MQETVDSVVVFAEGHLVSEFGVSELAGAQTVLARAKDLGALGATVERAGGKTDRGEELRVAEQDLESRYMGLTAGRGR